MSMHKSVELLKVCESIYKELQLLGFDDADLRNVQIVINDDQKSIYDGYQYSDYNSGEITVVPYDLHPIVKLLTQKIRQSSDAFADIEISGADLEDWKSLVNGFPQKHDEKLNAAAELHYYFYSVGIGALGISSFVPLPEEKLKILQRLKNVFELSYQRYIDVAQAEAQAREAKIELSLERVRARTMAMHNSDELVETSSVLFQELKTLGIETIRTGVGIIDELKQTVEIWYSQLIEKKENNVLGVVPFNIHPFFEGYYESWKRKDIFFRFDFVGDDVQRYYQTLSDIISYPAASGFNPKETFYTFFFPEGSLNVIAHKPLSEQECHIMLRFTRVFGLIYRRFLDLQKAEAQTRESHIEVALERVRSRTLAMHKSDELAETAAVVFRQLINLGIAPNRLYIGIIKDDSGNIELWATDEDGSKVSTQFTGNINRNVSIRKMYDAWKEQKKSLTIDMQGKELKDYFHYLSNELQVPFQLGLSQKRRIQSIAYFSKGFIGIASPDMQPEATTFLLERFAAVFNLTYTRFNDLKIAERHAEQAELDLIKLKEEKKRTEDALNELQATQKQLIQSEKMASLGELTAGIAHEIQNPLNFVNNFSEVSTELVDEMNTEIDNGNLEDAKQIAQDLKQNLKKINHHGKRAGDIVKGMLQHSRNSTATKEPTDLNKLADEYLRLAYHGLRAKDKSFNATMKTEFDESIGSIPIIPQDIGRVILNLITNAFYATTEKKKQHPENYNPTVSISTRKEGGKVFVSVKDNGNGIPQKVLDKIFQPFFTTKPTGQGTGLGLSLSYDIVKAHGGELKVETREETGAEFIMALPIA